MFSMTPHPSRTSEFFKNIGGKALEFNLRRIQYNSINNKGCESKYFSFIAPTLLLS